MKFYFQLFIGLFLSSLVVGQKLVPAGNVVAGGFDTLGNFNFSWSLGQPFYSNFITGTSQITAGIQQTNLVPQPPFISSFSPNVAGPGMSVLISGNNFEGTTAVSFGDIPAYSFTVLNPKTIKAIVATGASGNIKVLTQFGTAVGIGFSFSLEPSTSINNDVTLNQTLLPFGNVNAGGRSTIGNFNFSWSVGQPFNNTLIGGSNILTEGIQQIKLDIQPPTISSFSPSNTGSGVTVTIIGNNFSTASNVTIGGVAVTSFTILNTNAITTVVPSGVSSGNISVTTQFGTATLGGFVLCNPFAPSVSIQSSQPSIICKGISVIFTALPVNGGASPSYQWKRNGIVEGNGNSFSPAIIKDKDTISCIMTTSLTCVTTFTAKSSLVQSVSPVSTTCPSGDSLSGTTSGSFSVTNGGTASYTVPIVIPPGSSGTQPNINISYSSQGNNGLLGIGWSLQGLSAISRASETIGQDGVQSTVTYTQTDKFALDGERLQQKSVSGNYGDDNIEYRTEQNSFSKIVSKGILQYFTTNGNTYTSPSYFEVFTKSGLKMEYGDSSSGNARVRINGSLPLFWLLYKVTDTKGNYYTISYQINNSTGEYYPDKIVYTGNLNANVLPYCSIQFKYETRPDNFEKYFNGLNTTFCSKRISSIKCSYKDTIVRSYNFNYSTTNANLSLLSSLTECGSDGICHPPTLFDWEGIRQVNYASKKISPLGDKTDNFFDADLDGDGVLEIVKTTNSGSLEFFNGNKDTANLDFHQLTVVPNIAFNDNKRVSFADFNADGKTDLLISSFDGTIYYSNLSDVYINNSNENSNSLQFTLAESLPSHDNPISYEVADFNGDGRSDILKYYPFFGTCATLRISNSVGQSLNFTQYDSTTTPSLRWIPVADTSYRHFLTDINGDHKMDLLFYKKTNGDLKLFIQKDNYNFEAANININQNTGCDFFLSDFNNDGLPDIVRKNYNLNRIEVFTNKGEVFPDRTRLDFFSNLELTISGSQLGVPIANTSLKFVDFNQDGYIDITYYDTVAVNAGVLEMRYFQNNAGKGFVQVAGYTIEGNSPQLVGIGNYNSYSCGNLLVADLKNPFSWPETDTKNQKVLFIKKSPIIYNNLITKIKEGDGKFYEVKYDLLTNDSVYQKEESSVYPMLDYKASQYIVSLLSTSDGIGGKNSVSYKYSGAKVQMNGRGFRGFSKIETKNNLTGILQTKEFVIDYDSWKFGNAILKTSTTSLPNGTPISRTESISDAVPYCNGKSYFSFIKTSIASTYELDGSLTSTIRTSQEYDYFGNVITSVTDYGNGLKDSLVNIYTNDSLTWVLGRLVSSKLYRFAPGSSTVIRSSSFEYEPVSGILTKEIYEPTASVQIKKEKSYTYDAFGNILESTITAWNGTSLETRRKLTSYDALGRFVISSTNEIGQKSFSTYEPLLGKPITETDINGLVKKSYYDGFGRLIKTMLPDSNWITYEYRKNTDMATATSMIYTTSSTSPPVIKLFDVLDREIRMRYAGFDGTEILKDTKYDKRGLTIEETEPYFANLPPKIIHFAYDILGRKVSTLMPGDRKDSIQYKGKTTTYYNAALQKKTIVKNDKDQIIETSDNQGNKLNFEYDPAGNLLKTTDPNGNNLVYEYDIYGRKTKQVDPDMGTYLYENNGFGEIIKITDPASNEVTQEFDSLSRLTKKVEPEGTTLWVYDTQPFGKGLLAQVSGFNGYTKTYLYDSLSRVKADIQTINQKSYKQQYTYDIQGKVLDVIYPSGLIARNIYNANSYLSQIKNPVNQKVYWTATKLNAKGQLEEQLYGNGVKTTSVFNTMTNRLENIKVNKGADTLQNSRYDYDIVDNLIERRDLIQNKREAFSYDNLNRLTQSRVDGEDSIALTYNDIGNILSKSDVGIYQYGGVNNGPHRLISVTLTHNICIPSFQVKSEYNSFNKIKKISRDSTSVEVFYNANKQRVLQKMYADTNLIKTKVYVSAFYESEIANGDTLSINNIMAGDQVIATYTTHTLPKPPQLQYLHRDNLMSVVMITNDTGKVLGRYSFDSWGKRRNANWSSNLTDTSLLANDRGFTGHEHYELFDMIDMNGRIYDPVLGRFLSPDPFIQDPLDLQSYNRYSYVINNPLKYTDPSGYFLDFIGDFFSSVASMFSDIAHGLGSFYSSVANGIWSGIKAAGQWVGENWQTIAVVAVGIGVGILTGGSGLIAMNAYWSGATVGFATSVTSTLLAGGNLGDALLAGATGALVSGLSAGFSWEVGQKIGHATDLNNLPGKVISHGTIQGLSNVAQGGKFEHGFIAGALTPVASFGISHIPTATLKITSAAILGGTVSELAGGKFANGAMNSAFVQMYNEGWFDRKIKAMKTRVNNAKEYIDGKFNPSPSPSPSATPTIDGIMYDRQTNPANIIPGYNVIKSSGTAEQGIQVIENGVDETFKNE